MSTDAPFQPPRKKLSIFWWLGGFLLLFIFLFAFQLFGPNPAIIVSPQTTFITAPLAPDGLPDYEQFVREQCRKGVTPENNAAALLWPALWPGDLDPPQYAAVASELGLKAVPSTNDALTDPYKGTTQELIAAWLKNQSPKSDSVHKDSSDQSPNSPAPDSTGNDDPAGDLIDAAQSHPWTSKQIPPLAKWVIDNEKPLDRMVEASARPHCYFPSPSLLDEDRVPLIAALLPGAQAVRVAGRTLAVRAMWHAGEGHNDAAWRDLLAIHRIGHLTAQGKTIVEQLVGMSLDGMARESTLALLDQRSLALQQAQTIRRDLESLAHFNGVADSMDSWERLEFLDTVIQYGARKNPGALLSGSEFEDQLSYLNHVRVNWNVALQKGNDFYDRLVKAARIPEYHARKQALAQFESEVNCLSSETKQLGTLVRGVINPASRSDTVASVILAVFLPAVTTAMEAEVRTNSKLDLERLAAALAVFRLEQGKYPEKLEGLVPKIVAKLPVDLYNNKPFIYKRTSDGYLLYSAGENEKDDGGSNASENVYEGKSASELDTNHADNLRETIPSGADDWSIRFPRPQFKMPFIPSESTPNESS